MDEQLQKRVVKSNRMPQNQSKRGVENRRKDPPGVKRHRDQTLYRPDDYMKDDLVTASAKVVPEEALTDNEIVAVEREIRRFVDIRGGYKANIPDASKTRCRLLLKKIGRVYTEDEKDDKGKTLNKKGNGKVEWDRSITVPGMERY